MNRKDVVLTLKLAWFCDVGLEECTALTKTQPKDALNMPFKH